MSTGGLGVTAQYSVPKSPTMKMVIQHTNLQPYSVGSSTGGESRRKADLALESRRFSNKRTLICSLPSELLARIFRMGQDMQWDDIDTDETPFWDLVDENSFEVMITHVSSHFRNVAIASSNLWSDIIISSSSRLSSDKMETYLLRARGCGLAVRVEAAASSTISPLTSANIMAIIPYAKQYCQLVINVHTETSANSVIQRFSGLQMPRLRHLSISVVSVEGKHTSGTFLKIGAPHLSFLRLRGQAFTLFSPSLQNITTLHLDQTGCAAPILYSAFRNMVTSSPLRNLSIYGNMIDPHQADWPKPDDRINIPTLRYLRIFGVEGHVYSGLLLGITAPLLESLVLKDIRETDLRPLSAAKSVDFPQLQDLVLFDPQLPMDSFLELVRIFPAVTTLSVYGGSASKILQVLSNPNTCGVPWPGLHTISTLERCDQDVEDVIAVVRRRLSIGHPLVRVRLGTIEPLSTLPQFGWLDRNVRLESVSLPKWPALESQDLDDTLFTG